MTIEWIDTEQPPAPPPPVRPRRRATAAVLAIALVLVAAAVVSVGFAGRIRVVAGRGTSQPASRGVIDAPPVTTGGSLVFGNAVSSGLFPDAHEIIYLIAIRNTGSAPVHVVSLVAKVAPAQRPMFVGVSVIEATDSILTVVGAPPRGIRVIAPGATADVWVAMRYACGPRGQLTVPHPTVRLVTDRLDELVLGPDTGLVAPNDPALNSVCDGSTH